MFKIYPFWSKNYLGVLKLNVLKKKKTLIITLSYQRPARITMSIEYNSHEWPETSIMSRREKPFLLTMPFSTFLASLGTVHWSKTLSFLSLWKQCSMLNHTDEGSEDTASLWYDTFLLLQQITWLRRLFLYAYLWKLV